MSFGSNNSMGLEIPVLLSSECWVLYRKPVQKKSMFAQIMNFKMKWNDIFVTWNKMNTNWNKTEYKTTFISAGFKATLLLLV